MTIAHIRIKHWDGRVEERNLAIGNYVIGRESADILLDDPNASERHAQLDISAISMTVTDLGSTNGTLDSTGQRISTAHALKIHQFVQIGTTTLTLVAPPETKTGTQIMPQMPVTAAPTTSQSPTLSSPRLRGTVIKVPDHAPGLFVANGQQYTFSIAGLWRSPIAPTLNQIIEAELDSEGRPVAIFAIDTQQLAKERLGELGRTAEEHGRRAIAMALQSNNKGRVKLFALALAAVAGIVIVGAGLSSLFGGGLSKRSLAKQINEDLEDRRVCWPELESQVQNIKFPFFIEDNRFSSISPIILGLVQGGYLASESHQMDRGMLYPPQKGQLFNLTSKGQSEEVWDPEHGFCVGRKRVDEVVEWTEPTDAGGVQITQIDYTWRIGDRPSWVTEELFSDIPGMTTPKKSQAVALKKNDGWKVK